MVSGGLGEASPVVEALARVMSSLTLDSDVEDGSGDDSAAAAGF